MEDKKIVITYGTYDLLHEGHIRLLKRAKALGDYLIVGVTDENYDRSRGKLNVFQSTQDRVKAIEALDFVDKVIIETHKNQKVEDIQKYKADIFAIGSDWEGYFDYLNEYTKVIYLPRTEGISSTQLRAAKFKKIKIALLGSKNSLEPFIQEAKAVPNIEVDIIDSIHNLNSSYDAIYINSSSAYSLIKRALQLNKHILCENLLELEPSRVKELALLAKDKKLLLLSGPKNAYYPAFNEMVKRAKGIDLKELRATTNLEEYINSALLLYKTLGKSLSFDIFKHQENLSKVVVSRHKGDCLAISQLSSLKSKTDALLSGTKGYIYIPAPWWKTKKFYLNKKAYSYEFEGDGMRYMIAEFASLIQRQESESNILSLKDIIGINKLIYKFKSLEEVKEIK